MRFLILISAALLIGCSAYFQEVRENRHCHYELDQAYKKIKAQQEIIDNFNKADSIKQLEELEKSRYIDEIINR